MVLAIFLFIPGLGCFQWSTGPFPEHSASSQLWAHNSTEVQHWGSMEMRVLNLGPNAQPLTAALMSCSYIRVAGNCRTFPLPHAPSAGIKGVHHHTPPHPLLLTFTAAQRKITLLQMQLCLGFSSSSLLGFGISCSEASSLRTTKNFSFTYVMP